MTRAYQTEGIYYHYIIVLFLNRYLKLVFAMLCRKFLLWAFQIKLCHNHLNFGKKP